jgi:YidC/Oxa1 family membrane protein insertase
VVTGEGAHSPESEIVSPDQSKYGGTVEAIAAGEERQIIIDAPLYTAVLTNRGGAIKSFKLKKFRETREEIDSHVQLVHITGEGQRFPLLAEFTGVGGPLGFADSLFTTSGQDVAISNGENVEVSFRFRTAEGLELIKTLVFQADTYEVLCDLKIINLSDKPLNGRVDLTWAPGLEPPANAAGKKIMGASRYGYTGALSFDGKRTKKIKGKKLEGTELFESAPVWIASEDMYFAAVLMPQKGADGALARKHNDGRVEIGIYSQVKLAPGAGDSLVTRVYIGPKEMSSLKAVDRSLVKVIDLGWFGIIAKPLLEGLNFFNGYVGNYGLSIIILSTLIKLVFIPFSTISHRSMKKMQNIQPQITAIRDRYKKDKEKMNTETMKLYSEYKVNPAGGCLPIMVQIPVFFALYRALLSAIELRHAPFYFWIVDLSAKDPLYITPIIMGATMVLQQKMTPTTGDPRQAKIMMFMPIVFTALFLSFPSGLVVYWTVNNVLTIGHQYILNKEPKGDKSAPAPDPKKKGKGKKKQKSD